MFKRLIIYVVLLFCIGAFFAYTSSYVSAELDVAKADAALKTVNGDDADYKEYKAIDSGASFLQKNSILISLCLVSLVTVAMWYKPLIQLIPNKEENLKKEDSE